MHNVGVACIASLLMIPPMTIPLRAPRAATALGATLGLSAAAWVVTVRQMHGMDMGVATPLGSLAFFMALWVPMMAAMMLPGAAQAVLSRAPANGPVRAVVPFVASYLAVWTLVGALLYAVYRPHGSAVAGALVIAAGVYELTRLKQHCRRGRPRKAAAGEGEGVPPPPRRAERRAAQVADGGGREGVRVPGAGGTPHARRSFRREAPAPHLSLHVRS